MSKEALTQDACLASLMTSICVCVSPCHPSHAIIAILLLYLVDHRLDSRVIWLDLVQVVPRTLIFRFLLKVLTHLYDFIDQVCLLEGGALLEQRYQHLLD